MSIFFNQLQEQIDLLKSKGYNEESLNSPDKEGWLFTQLKRSFSDALHQSWQESDSISFSLRTTGFFNDDKDIINIQLHYLFDIENASLVLTGLELRAKKLNRKILIMNSKDLPHTSSILELIRQQAQLEQKRLNQYRPIHEQAAAKRNK